jgi:hypothetical protein
MSGIGRNRQGRAARLNAARMARRMGVSVLMALILAPVSAAYARGGPREVQTAVTSASGGEASKQKESRQPSGNAAHASSATAST